MTDAQVMVKHLLDHAVGAQGRRFTGSAAVHGVCRHRTAGLLLVVQLRRLRHRCVVPAPHPHAIQHKHRVRLQLSPCSEPVLGDSWT